jgi:cytoskeletal protein CcmA (bactofilin family)
MALRKQKKALSEEDKKIIEDRLGSKVTVISQSSRFKGTITGQDQLIIFGNVEGDINCEGVVWITNKGKVDGNVKGLKVIVEGEVKGNIESAELVEIKSEGSLIGNIKAAKFRLTPGCFFDGEVKMPREALNSLISGHDKKGEIHQKK